METEKVGNIKGMMAMHRLTFLYRCVHLFLTALTALAYCDTQRIEPLLMVLVTPGLFLLIQVRFSAV